MDIFEISGEKIRTLRDSLGWTREHLSDLSEIPARTIQDIETGVVKNPGIKTIIPLLNAMKPHLPQEEKKEVDPIEALGKALSVNGSIIIPLEEYEQLKANQLKSPELAEIIKMIDDFGDKNAYKKILRNMNISMENFVLFFELVDPNKKKKASNQESHPQTPQQETDKPLTPKRSG